MADKGNRKRQIDRNVKERNTKAVRNRPSDRQERLYMDASETGGKKKKKVSKLILCIQGKI